MNRHAFRIFLLLSMSAGGCSIGSSAQVISDTIPLGGNTWSSSPAGRIDSVGFTQWSDSNVRWDTWLRVSKPGQLHVWVRAGALDHSSSVIRISMDKGEGHDVTVSGDLLISYDAGVFEVTDTGYHCIHIKGISRTEVAFPLMTSIIVRGQPINGRTAFVPNNEGNFFYWGRRGPSVHLHYPVPAGEQAEWFYNEVTVPVGQDLEGSYFMACGFAQGYFGMQVNSPTERHILFSVWSPFATDDPASVPDSQRIRVLKKGEGVHAQAFGNEGSGGQSYLNYMWKPGQSYKFLVHAQPAADRHTVFTAWFYAPEEGRWRLIASFSRPQTQTWLTGLHSFLENFDPGQGIYRRYVEFNHQWIRDTAGRWIGLHRAEFTTDNTGRKGYRMDYAGGVRNSAFYLENCGHFSTYTTANTWFERPGDPSGQGPGVDVGMLPAGDN
jgi:Domain of unknown function (DUF3472)/Domain of unknown function (DUF5077)